MTSTIYPELTWAQVRRSAAAPASQPPQPRQHPSASLTRLLCIRALTRRSASQRKDRLFITIQVKDCADADVKLFAEGRVSFTGTAGDKAYALELDLYGGIKPDESRTDKRSGGVALTVMKAEAGDHWPRLGKEKKNNRVRVNFDLWQDQDKEEEEEKAAELQKLKDELEGVGKDDSGKTEEEKMEDEAYELMMKMYQLLLYACCAVAWLYVLLRALLDLLAGGDVWESVGHVALFLQLTGWVRSPARGLPRRTDSPQI